MVYLNDEALEMVVGGASAVEYGLIAQVLETVATSNPVLTGNINEQAFNALFRAAVLKVIHTTDV